MRIKTGLTTVSLLVVVVLSLLLAACGGDKEKETREHVDTGYADVVLKLEPDPPVALKDVLFTAEVRDKEGRPVTGADVLFNLSMPGMYHGENMPVAGETEPGIYRGKGILTMAGKWLVVVEVKAPGIDVRRSFYTVAEGG